MKLNKNDLAAAREYAFLLLKYRMRSEHELRLRMRRKKFDERLIDETAEFLKEKKFIDDDSFAKAWVFSRKNQGFGLSRIAQELKLKGVPEEIVKNRISEGKGDYPEKQIVGELASRRLSKSKGVDPKTAKRRVYAYLLRRGFSPDVVIEVLNSR